MTAMTLVSFRFCARARPEKPCLLFWVEFSREKKWIENKSKKSNAYDSENEMTTRIHGEQISEIRWKRVREKKKEKTISKTLTRVRTRIYI